MPLGCQTEVDSESLKSFIVLRNIFLVSFRYTPKFYDEKDAKGQIIILGSRWFFYKPYYKEKNSLVYQLRLIYNF